MDKRRAIQIMTKTTPMVMICGVGGAGLPDGI